CFSIALNILMNQSQYSIIARLVRRSKATLSQVSKQSYSRRTPFGLRRKRPSDAVDVRPEFQHPTAADPSPPDSLHVSRCRPGLEMRRGKAPFEIAFDFGSVKQDPPSEAKDAAEIFSPLKLRQSFNSDERSSPRQRNFRWTNCDITGADE